VNVSRQLVIFIFLLFATLFFGMLFWPFILNEIIRPISLVVWLLLRIFVLSIDQKYYWGALIFLMVFFIYRLLPQEQAATYPSDFQSSNATLRTIDYWRNLFLVTSQNGQDDKTLKRELIRLLISLYATKQRTAANFGIYEALQQGEIPIPEHIHAFLFTDDASDTDRSLKKRVQVITTVPQKWMRRLSGQETAEHHRMINEVLVFLETALEIKK
jgi:hypothetical protein